MQRRVLRLAAGLIALCGSTTLLVAASVSTAGLAGEVQKQLDAELALWFPRCIDREQGGYHQVFDQQWQRIDRRGRNAVFQARMIWVTSTIAREFPDRSAEYRGYAAHGLEGLKNTLVDSEKGGVYWQRQADGSAGAQFGDEKHAYALAFVIYAAATSHDVLPDAGGLELAKQTFAWLDRHGHDATNGGYYEAFTRDGTPILKPEQSPRPDARLDCLGTPYGFKSMNAHLHLLEAFTALYQRWQDPTLKGRLAELHRLMLTKMFVEPGALHLHYTFDWRPVPGVGSFGHDVEAAYLLTESAEALGMADDAATQRAAQMLVDHALDVGWDAEHGGLFMEGGALRKPVNLTKNWWTQAESLNALLLMHERHGRTTPVYGQRFLQQWQFIRDKQIDARNGGWFSSLEPDGQPQPGQAKGHEWKACYHNGRAMLNVAKRLKALPPELQKLEPPPAPATQPATRPAKLLIDIKEGKNPWTHLNIRDGGADFQFAVVSDNAGAMRPGVFAKGVTALNRLQPQFVMSVGDFINGYRNTPEEINAMWDEFLPQVYKLEPPFFFVPGNHDFASNVMRPIWFERFGRAYYHFVYQDVLFLCLNSNDRNPYKGYSPEQVAYIKKVLQENDKVRWTFVFQHRPLWIEKDAEGWSEIEPLLAARQHTVFCGHLHQYIKEQRNGGTYYTLSVTGGGNLLRGPAYGDFDHIAWVTMTSAGPKIANIDINAVHGDDVRTTATRTIAWTVDRAVTFRPVRVDADTYAGGQVVMKVRNGSELPVHITGTIRPHHALQAVPRAVDMSLPPLNKEQLAASEQELTVELTATRTLHVDDLAPLEFEGKVTYTLPDGKPFTMPLRSRLVFDRVLPIGAEKAPEIDLIQPAAVTGNTSGWTGTGDASAKFGVAADEQFVYLTAHVTDDTYIPGDNGDAIEFWLDARPDGQRLSGIGDSPKQQRANILRLVAVPVATNGQPMAFGADRLPEGARWSGERKEGGYTVEIAIPTAYLDEKQKKRWQDLRLNVCIRDVDAAGEEHAEIWWRPDWRARDNFPGSGTFRRAQPAANAGQKRSTSNGEAGGATAGPTRHNHLNSNGG